MKYNILRGLTASGIAFCGLIFCSVRKLVTLDLERDDGLQGIPKAQRKAARRRRQLLRQEQEKI